MQAPPDSSAPTPVGIRFSRFFHGAKSIWRTSLQFRTVAIAVVLSGLAVTLIGGYMSVVVADNQFDFRRNEVETEHVRATLLAQDIFSNAFDVDDPGQVDLEELPFSAVKRILSSTASPGTTGFALLRSAGQASPRFMQTLNTDGVLGVISPDLRRSVSESEGRVYLQSVTLHNGAPGLVAGSLVEVPTAGNYELYLVYDLTDAASTLSFVQQTLAIGLFLLVGMIGAVTYFVVRLVVSPVREAAKTSERLAAGQLEQRIPVRGVDELATLAQSFNGMADSLQQKITRLAELSRVQQRFVSDVSHELRTPLTTIRLAGEVLFDQKDTFTPTTARTAELLHTQVERFDLLLADLLEISRYDAGAVELELESTSVVGIVEDVVEGFQPVAEERGSGLRLVAPGGYFEAEVDPRRIRRVLRNLLGNAIEHGEGKPIVVTIDSNQSAFAISVRDYGIGMDAAQAERVFHRFWRADPSRKRTIGGTGLGLAIALEDAVLHEGTLEVWSEPGNGTSFTLTLPRERGMAIISSPLEGSPSDGPPLGEVHGD